MCAEEITRYKLSTTSKIEVKDMARGIWYLRDIKKYDKYDKGSHATFLLEKIEECPDVLSLAQFEDLRYDIARAIVDYLNKNEALLEFHSTLRPLGVTISELTSFILHRLQRSHRTKK